MENRGRPRKETNPADIERRKEAGRRIVQLRHENRWTQDELAEKVERAPISIGRYERGEQDIPERTARQIEGMTGVFWKYWTGETHFKDRGEYLRQERIYRRQESIAREKAEDEGSAEYEKERAEYQSQLRALFSLCGYCYEDNSVEADFYDLVNPDNESEMPPCRHKVTDYKNPEQVYQFDDEELKLLIVEFRDTIGYSWYKKVMAHSRCGQKK